MADRRSVLIVVNPTSGRGRGEKTSRLVATLLRASGFEVAVRHTARIGDAEIIARRACEQPTDRPAVVMPCGGDGTIQEVANAIAPLREVRGLDSPLLALAPAGRCNDFARVLGILPDPTCIADAVVGGGAMDVDLGRINDRYFCTVATLGADAEVSDFVDRMRFPLAGTPAYIYGAIRVLLRYRSKRVRLSGDFGVIEKQVFLASSANTSSYGGAIPIAPDATPTDGKLDLCLIDAVSRRRSMWLLPTVLTGRHARLSIVKFIQTTGFTLESDEPLDVWADGERLARTPIRVSIAPAAIRVAVPARAPLTSAPAGRTLRV